MPDYGQKSQEELEQDAITIARILNRVPLIERRTIVEMMYKKLLLADTSARGFRYFAVPLDLDNRWLLFLAFRGERADRVKLLKSLCYLTIIKMHSKSALGIATENMNSIGGRSFDWMLLDYAETPNDPDAEAQIDNVFGDEIPMQFYDFPHEGRKIVLPFD